MQTENRQPLNTVEAAAFMETSVEAPQKAKGRIMIEVSNPITTQPNELTSVCYMPMVTAMLFIKANIHNQHVSPERKHMENIKFMSH